MAGRYGDFMFDGFVMTTDVLAAIVQLLPVFLIAAIVDHAAAIRQWPAPDEMTRRERRSARGTLVIFVLVAAQGLFLEILFLLYLNAGEIRGALALLYWIVAIEWFALLLFMILVNSIPKLTRTKRQSA